MSRFELIVRGARAVAAWAGLGLLAACTENDPAGAASLSARAHPAQSQSLLAAVLDHFADRPAGRLLVDPRPLRADAELTGLELDDLLPADTPTIELRRRYLESRGIGLTDASADMECAFASGLAPPPGPERDQHERHRAECLRRGYYTSVVFGLPQSVTGGETGAAWKVRAVRMTTSSYSVWDVYLSSGPGGTWRVVEARRLLGVQS